MSKIPSSIKEQYVIRARYQYPAWIELVDFIHSGILQDDETFNGGEEIKKLIGLMEFTIEQFKSNDITIPQNWETELMRVKEYIV